MPKKEIKYLVRIRSQNDLRRNEMYRNGKEKVKVDTLMQWAA